MSLDGCRGQVEGIGDLTVGLSVGDLDKYLAFPVGQVRQRAGDATRRRTGAELFQLTASQ